MNILLDTQILIWIAEEDKRLTKNIKEIIFDNKSVLHLSIASLLEIAIKTNLGKLKLSKDFDIFIDELELSLINILKIELSHIKHLRNLENHHRDPFDRIIISQNIVEGFHLITSDNKFVDYPGNISIIE